MISFARTEQFMRAIYYLVCLISFVVLCFFKGKIQDTDTMWHLFSLDKNMVVHYWIFTRND